MTFFVGTVRGTLRDPVVHHSGIIYQKFTDEVRRGQTWLFELKGGELRPCITMDGLREEMEIAQGARDLQDICGKEPEKLQLIIETALRAQHKLAHPIGRALRRASYQRELQLYNAEFRDGIVDFRRKGWERTCQIKMSPNGNRISIRWSTAGQFEVNDGILDAPWLRDFIEERGTCELIFVRDDDGWLHAELPYSRERGDAPPRTNVREAIREARRIANKQD